jgi:CRP/FNR family transcriptional regulator, cyclic AMP receptor protein
MAAEITMLQEAPMFALLDESELQTVSELLDHRRFDKGATIFTYGDAGDCIYVLRSGRVQVYVENTEGEKIILAEYEPGDSFGEISLLDGGPRTATAVAVDDTEALTFDRENLLDFVRRHPHAAIDMLTAMGKRLRATDELLRTHVSRNINEEEEERLTFGQRIADRVAVFGGSWTFIIFFGFVLVSWMFINVVILAHLAWDPYPFILLNLVLSTLAALQAPIIMMSQNRQSSKDRLKADLDYQVNLKAELEVAQLHNKVDRIYEEMQAQFAKLNGRDKKTAGMNQ